MKLSQIESQANRGHLAAGAFNIRSTLRFEVIPEFYRKVSDATWLRRNRLFKLVPPQREYDLPIDFRSMISVGNKGAELKYIGEDPMLVTAAEMAVTASCPAGYYFVQDSENLLQKAIRFSAEPDMEYSLPYVYRSRLVFHNDADDTELDEHIPPDYQQALIQGLRAEIYLDRFGQQDQRYVVADQRFREIIEEAKEGAHDMARRNYAVYCD